MSKQIFWDTQTKGEIIFGRDDDGNLVWSVSFEVPLPSDIVKLPFTIFRHQAFLLANENTAAEYRDAISAISKQFEEWVKASKMMWLGGIK